MNHTFTTGIKGELCYHLTRCARCAPATPYSAACLTSKSFARVVLTLLTPTKSKIFSRAPRGAGGATWGAASGAAQLVGEARPEVLEAPFEGRRDRGDGREDGPHVADRFAAHGGSRRKFSPALRAANR